MVAFVHTNRADILLSFLFKFGDGLFFSSNGTRSRVEGKPRSSAANGSKTAVPVSASARPHLHAKHPREYLAPKRLFKPL